MVQMFQEFLVVFGVTVIGIPVAHLANGPGAIIGASAGRRAQILRAGDTVGRRTIRRRGGRARNPLPQLPSLAQSGPASPRRGRRHPGDGGREVGPGRGIVGAHAR